MARQEDHDSTAKTGVAGREAAWAMAVRYTASRPRTSHEVAQHLARRGVSEALRTAVVAELQERGILDDATYTRAYVASRLQHRGYGPQRLQRELQQRGVGRALVEDTVQHTIDAEDVHAAALAQAAKRWQRLAQEADPAKRRQKVYDFLRRRGFASEVAQHVLGELAADDARP